MWTENKPIPVKEIKCDICQTTIKDIQLEDLDWYHAKLHFNQPHIKCPICNNEIFDVLEKK